MPGIAMSHEERPTPRPIVRDPFARLRMATPARIGLGQTGDGLPTTAVLEFQLAHARARDAVHASADFDVLAGALAPIQTLVVASEAADRVAYLQRPDHGRRLDPKSAALLPTGPFDVAFVIADGLSARAVDAQAAGVLKSTMARLPSHLTVAPIVLARQARVALGDDIGEALGAHVVAVLIGERPGLSVADSLGVYLTFDPKRGRRDSERNCISNIHGNGGLTADAAADKLVWLITEAFRLQLSGVGLKDDQDAIQLLTTDE
jgi:ethanolamine ammonia-lyase small subunit